MTLQHIYESIVKGILIGIVLYIVFFQSSGTLDLLARTFAIFLFLILLSSLTNFKN